MGFEDREYFRERPAWTGGSQTRSIVTTLIIINAGVYLIDNLLMGPNGPLQTNFRLLNLLELPADFYNRPIQAYRVVTAGFAHSPMGTSPGIMHILMNMYMLWLFGRDVEGVYGRKEFIRLYLGLVIAASLIWALVQNLQGYQPGSAPAMIGASGAVMGVMMLYVMHFPHRKFMMLFIPFPVPAWTLGLLYICMDIFGALGATHRGNVAFSAHLGGAAVAYLYYRSGIRLSKYLAMDFSLDSLKPRPRVKIHNPESRTHGDTEADRILDKVHQHGADSITPAERKILEEYSRRMRQKHR